MLHPKSHSRFVLAIAFALALSLSLAVVPARAQTRMQIIPFDSVTLSSEQILLGEMQGNPVTLAGELRLPRGGTDKVPVVVLVHGVGGLSAKEDEWARALNSWGIGVFIPDHLSGRGFAAMSAGDYQLSGVARMVDVYHAVSRLLKHPRIDPERIAIVGFSMGGAVTLLSSQERFRTRYAPPNVQFAAYIALYPSCAVRLRDDAKVVARPIRLFYGTGDNWTSVEQCRTLVADMKKAGADVTLTEYPEATHAYDDPGFKVRLNVPQAISVRKCSLVEGDGGTIMNSQTGNLFTASDACIERGVSLQYDEAATASTREAVKAALASAFAAKPAAAAAAEVKMSTALHGQGSKKTITLPNGEVILDLSGEWNVLIENYGANSWAGTYPQLVKVTQTGSSFVAVRMMDDPHNKKGAEQIRGELDKNGFKRVQMVSVLGGIDASGTIGEDGNKMVIDNGVRARATYTRK